MSSSFNFDCECVNINLKLVTFECHYVRSVNNSLVEEVLFFCSGQGTCMGTWGTFGVEIWRPAYTGVHAAGPPDSKRRARPRLDACAPNTYDVKCNSALTRRRRVHRALNTQNTPRADLSSQLRAQYPVRARLLYERRPWTPRRNSGHSAHSHRSPPPHGHHLTHARDSLRECAVYLHASGGPLV